MIKASCLCGAVALEINGPLRNARFCHCANCRKFSGTGYAAWGLVATEQLKISAAPSSVSRYNSGGGFRAFCASCGSPLWYEPEGRPQYRGIPLGIVDEGDVPTPAMHVWTRSKVSWTSLPGDVPAHETHP